MHIAYIPQRDCHVAQVAAPLGAFDRGSLEALVEFLCCERQFLGQMLRRALLPECRIPFLRKSIPWADCLAYIAAEHPISHLIAKLDRNTLFQFDREIGNAPGCVDRAVCEDAVRGTGFDAARAGATVVCDEWRVRFELEIQQDL